MASRTTWLALVVGLAASAPSAALAAPSAAERDAARRLMDEGKSRLKANDTARAVEAFQRAHEIMHVPTTGVALARAHVAAGHLVEAHEVALEVLRTPRDAHEPAVFDAARRSAKDLDAHLKARVPTVRVRTKGGEASHIVVDDVAIAASAAGDPIPLNPGKHVVTAKSAGGIEARGEVELAERDRKELELTFASHPEPHVAATKPESSSTEAPRLRGFGNDDVDVGSRERTSLALGLIYGGLGLGVVGLGLGTVTGAMTLSKASDVESQCENKICAPGAKDDLDRANSLSNISTIAFAAGGVGVALGIVGLLLPRRRLGQDRAALTWEWSRSLSIRPVASGIGGTF